MMLRSLIILLSASYFLAFISAQQLKTERVAPPPPPANDYFPQRWKEYLSKDGGFRMLFPVLPKETSQTQETPAGQIVTRSASYKSFIQYTVMYAAYPRDIEQVSNNKALLDRIRDGSLAAVAQGKPRIVKEADVEIGGHAGRFLQVELADNTVVRMKWAANRNKVYVISVTTPKGHTNALGAENDYEKIATSFLDSFSFVESGGEA